MRIHHYARFLSIAALALILSACASSPYHYTKILNVRQNVEKPARPPYQHPVVGVLVDSPDRGALENAVVAALRARGVDARAALPIFGDKGIENKSRSYLAQQISQHGFDSAIGIHLVNKSIQNVNVNPAPSAPAPTAAGPTLKSQPLGPGFSLNEQTYVAHINFWDIKQQAIVWSATSVTRNPKGLQKGAKQFANAVVKQLMKAGLFSASNNKSS